MCQLRGQKGNSFPYCCVLDRVYVAVAWQRVDQIRYIIVSPRSLGLVYRSFTSPSAFQIAFPELEYALLRHLAPLSTSVLWNTPLANSQICALVEL
jgi:hypothetical protein